MRLTAKQLLKLRRIVSDHHTAFVASWINPKLLPPKVLKRLQQLGLFRPKASVVRDAYLLGTLAGRANEGPMPSTYTQLKQRLQERPIPLSETEQHAVHVAEMTAGQYVTGLGVRVAQQAGNLVLRQSLEAAQQDRAVIAQTTKEALEHRRDIKGLKSDLGHASLDWTRDLERVANTEMSAALNSGTAMAIKEDEGERCAVMAAPSCCDICRRAYNLPDGRAKVWKLSELQANGTNVGRKTAELLPVCPPMHPNCSCTLVCIPVGMHINRDGDLVEDDGEAPHGKDKTAQVNADKVQQGGEARAEQLAQEDDDADEDTGA